MLIQCPECGLQASDKAFNCPHCGYPLQGQPKQNEKRRSNKRKRLPNGFGQITKLNNKNLRNQYRAMVTIGKDENGRPICKLLKPNAYFLTYNDAYVALVEYNKNPYCLESDITMNELYELWSKQYFEKISDSLVKSIKASWAYCSAIYDMKVSEVRARHVKMCVNEGSRKIKGVNKPVSAAFKSRIKSTLNQMLDYAVEYELTDKNYARTVVLDRDNAKTVNKERKSHINYTEEELNIFWNNAGKDLYVDMVLIQCYSGWRPQELCRLKLSDVDLKEWTFKGGIKTEAGIDRTVPIHSKIRDLVQNRYNESVARESKYLFNSIEDEGKMIGYGSFHYRYRRMLDQLNINSEHRCHDGRVQFVTSAKKYNVDEYAIKYMVGHAIDDVTEKVYTRRDISWLKEEIEKIK